jgi:5-methylthioribose kinase
LPRRLHLSAEQHAAEVERFANTEMVRANEDVVLVLPFTPGHATNSWTSPELDCWVQRLWASPEVAQGAEELLGEYRWAPAAGWLAGCSRAAVPTAHVPAAPTSSVSASHPARRPPRCRSQKHALIHNDLHAGNLLVAPASLHLIDWEFATYGPPAFDLGTLFASLLLARACHLAAAAAAAAGGRGSEAASSAAAEQHGEWLLQVVVGVWEGVCRPAAGQSLLDVAVAGSGAAGGGSSRGAAQQQQQAERELLADALGFAGMCVLRQVVGIHRYQGFGTVPGRSSRAACEQACLEVGVRLLVGRRGFASIASAVECISMG